MHGQIILHGYTLYLSSPTYQINNVFAKCKNLERRHSYLYNILTVASNFDIFKYDVQKNVLLY